MNSALPHLQAQTDVLDVDLRLEESADPSGGQTLTDECLHRLRHTDLLKVNGRVKQVIGLVIESLGPNCSLGDVCVIKSKDGEEVCLSEVVGLRDNRVLSMILGDATKVGPGSEIVATDRPLIAWQVELWRANLWAKALRDHGVTTVPAEAVK